MRGEVPLYVAAKMERTETTMTTDTYGEKEPRSSQMKRGGALQMPNQELGVVSRHLSAYYLR
jgi:hypothetical protein